MPCLCCGQRWPTAHWRTCSGAKRRIYRLIRWSGALDSAGGTVVHISSGISALAAAFQLLVVKNLLWPASVSSHNAPFILLGAGLLWFGWSGLTPEVRWLPGGPATVAFVATSIQAQRSAALTLIDLLERSYGVKHRSRCYAVAGLVNHNLPDLFPPASSHLDCRVKHYSRLLLLPLVSRRRCK